MNASEKEEAVRTLDNLMYDLRGIAADTIMRALRRTRDVVHNTTAVEGEQVVVNTNDLAQMLGLVERQIRRCASRDDEIVYSRMANECLAARQRAALVEDENGIAQHQHTGWGPRS